MHQKVAYLGLRRKIKFHNISYYMRCFQPLDMGYGNARIVGIKTIKILLPFSISLHPSILNYIITERSSRASKDIIRSGV